MRLAPVFRQVIPYTPDILYQPDSSRLLTTIKTWYILGKAGSKPAHPPCMAYQYPPRLNPGARLIIKIHASENHMGF